MRPITLPWQPFKQCVPSSPFSPLLHTLGPGGILAHPGLQAACRQLCQAAQGVRAFQRAPTAACYLIVLHKSSYFLWAALQSYHSVLRVICLSWRYCAVFSPAGLVHLGFGGLCLLGLKGRQTHKATIKINSCSRTDFSVRNSFLCRKHNILWIHNYVLCVFSPEAIAFGTMLVNCQVAPDATRATLQVKHWWNC